jgi:hypothetical protein
MTTKPFAQIRGSRTLKLAAASSALAATAAIGGLSVSASAHDATTTDTTAYDAAQEPVTTTHPCFEDTSEDPADEYASEHSDDSEHENNQGGSPTGLAHSQRWHAAAAHESQPPTFAANGSTDETSTSSDDSSESSDDQSDDSSEDQSGSEHADDSEHSDDSEQADHGDEHGDHYGDHEGDQEGDHGGDQGGEHDD